VNRRIAWILILIVDLGYIAWGAMAALAPNRLMGPGGMPIVPAGYEGYTKVSWQQLMNASPKTAEYITIVFRMYGVYNVVFSLIASLIAITAFRRGERWAWWALFLGNTIALVSAEIYDKTVHAIGPFEVTEYLGLLMVWVALGLTARAPKPLPVTG
jgi:hypothetical protein